MEKRAWWRKGPGGEVEEGRKVGGKRLMERVEGGMSGQLAEGLWWVSSLGRVLSPADSPDISCSYLDFTSFSFPPESKNLLHALHSHRLPFSLLLS